jgi:hypothetical protein
MMKSLGPLAREGARSSIASTLGMRRAAVGATLVLLPVAMWCITHRYHGLVGDAELYAVQALSRTDAGLAHDVFLTDASQDRYTIFSPIYAFFIKRLGLQQAAISLLVLFKVGFYASAWIFSRKFFDARAALLTSALLIVVPIEYGGFHVFRVAEDMLTARSMAESLAMTGLCLHVYGRENAGLALAVFALGIHALMALPIVFLLLSLRMSCRASLLGALAAIAAALCAASTAAMAPRWAPGFLRVMDPSWLDMVRERSLFVFPQLWRRADWESNARPFVSLALGILVIPDERLRRLCAAAMTVGAAGLAIAFVAGAIGPIAILLQGQAWRWTWVTGLAGALMLAPTVLIVWRCDRCGPLCAALLLAGWLVAAVDGMYFISAALGLWYVRKRIAAGMAPYLRAATAVIGLLILARIIGTGWAALSSPAIHAGTENRILSVAGALVEQNCVPIVLAFLLGSWALRSRSMAVPGFLALALAAVTAFAAPRALENPLAEGTSAQIEEFSDWRDAIPAGENVLIVPRYYTAGFAWFTLRRPSYLTVDQSSGVIFSSATAAEIRRRSDVLLPLEGPDWRLLSRRATHGGKFDAAALPLTRDRLLRICADPELNFVVAKEDLAFRPIRHHHAGIWDGWNLYDCRQVNSSEHTE